jgi:hypothetical protein
MFRRPDSSSFSLSIDDDFDESRSYRAKLFEIEQRESQFGKGNFLFWKLNLYRDDGTAFMDQRTGEVFELWASTSDSTFANATTGQRAKARQYIEAFVGREMSDDEVNELIDSGANEMLVGKTALGSFEIVENNGNEKLQVVKLRPDKAPSRTAAPAAPAPAPAQEVTGYGARQRAPRRIDD